MAKTYLSSKLKEFGILPAPNQNIPMQTNIGLLHPQIITRYEGGTEEHYLNIGGLEERVLRSEETNTVLVPRIVFHDNPRQLSVMRAMLKVGFNM